MKNILKNCGIGLGIGSVIYNIMGFLFTTGAVQKNILLVFVMSLIIGGLSSIYEVEKLSILAQTSIQLICSYGAFLLAAYFGKWFPIQLRIIVTASLMFMIIFLVIWTFFYLGEKKEIEKINKKIS